MNDILKAPWTKEVVKALNAFQRIDVVHPFTCGRDDCNAALVATVNGWICPLDDYTQDWAHLFMCDERMHPYNPYAPLNRRKIDPRYHIEGNQIIKTSNGTVIPEDEPTIIFRARDWLTVPLLYAYYELACDDKCVQEHLDGIQERIREFEKFAVEHPDRMKQPGVTRGL